MSDAVSIADVSVTDDQASPSHPEHQRWVKQTLVEDTQKWMQNLPPSQQWTHSQIDAKIAEDVRLHYAREREEAHRTAIAPPPVDQRGDDPAAEMAENLGFGFERKPDQDEDTRYAMFRRDSMSCRFCGTCRNCRRIQRVQMLVGTYRDSDGNVFAQYPGLSADLMKLFWQYRANTGEFAEVSSKRDKVRIFHRRIDDICDRSRPLLGDWY